MKSKSTYRPITSWNEVPVIFDIPMAARLLRQGYHTLIKKCERGELPAFKIGREWRISKDAFFQYMKEKVIVANKTDKPCRIWYT